MERCVVGPRSSRFRIALDQCGSSLNGALSTLPFATGEILHAAMPSRCTCRYKGQSNDSYCCASTGLGLMRRPSFKARGYSASKQRQTSSPYSATRSSKTSTSMSLSVRASPRASEPYNNMPRRRRPYTVSSAERIVFNSELLSMPKVKCIPAVCQALHDAPLPESSQFFASIRVISGHPLTNWLYKFRSLSAPSVPSAQSAVLLLQRFNES